MRKTLPCVKRVSKGLFNLKERKKNYNPSMCDHQMDGWMDAVILIHSRNENESDPKITLIAQTTRRRGFRGFLEHNDSECN